MRCEREKRAEKRRMTSFERSELCSLVSDVFAKHSVNLALNRPTWQSSNFTNSSTTTRNSWYAVDGNFCTNMNLGCCSSTATGDSMPWLAVDLGSMTYVYGAAVTNRDSFGLSQSISWESWVIIFKSIVRVDCRSLFVLEVFCNVRS